MAYLATLGNPLDLALQAHQVSPLEAWQLHLAQALQMDLTRHGHLLMTWARLLEIDPQLMQTH